MTLLQLYRVYRQKLPAWLQALGAVLGLLLLVRLLPFLSPLRSQDLQPQSPSLSFTDRWGRPLGTLLNQSHNHVLPVSLDQVPPHLIAAILAAEDDDFYHHGPLDLLAIARALQQRLETGQVQSGASTITLQLARIHQNRPRTLLAKLAEVWDAWRIGAGMSRTEILTAYLNRIPMGGNRYGVEAAARTYFGVAARDLSLSQATALAAIPNNPTGLNPYRYPQAYRGRQAYILERMVKLGKIRPEQAQRAKRESLYVRPQVKTELVAPHFLFWVRQQLPRYATQPVQTSLDASLQGMVETQIRQVLQELRSHQVRQGAAIVLDNPTGEVLAYAGSQDYFDREHLGSNDGVQALRQPGSTLKPFLYQLALEQKRLQPTTILADVPTHYALPQAQVYSPTDYSSTFLGPVRLRLALANSLNVPAVRVLEKIGVSTFLQRLHQLGFTDLRRPPEDYGLGLTLGSGEVTLLQLAQAYRTMANQGQRSSLVTVFPRPHPVVTPALGDSDAWAIVTDMLRDPQARAYSFGVDSVLNLPFPAAVKTGTSSNYRDTWTVGFSRRYTVATWVGNFDGSSMQKVSGVTGAAPLWNRILRKLHEQDVPADFSPPQAFVKGPVCAESGLKATPACPTIVQDYLPRGSLAHDSGPDPRWSAEYDDWLARQPELAPMAPLKLVFPRQGDQFLLASPRSSIRLGFVLAGPARQESATWQLNGRVIYTGLARQVFQPVSQGQWTLTVRSADGQSSQVVFEVLPPRKKVGERGFSVGPWP